MLRERICEFALVYTLGALGYCLTEVLWRGYSHWTMTVTGGVCFMLIYSLNRRLRGKPLLLKCLMGAFVVTVVEFIVGCVVNLMLGWKVWDYSREPFSLYGQVCLPFFGLWFLLCIPVVLLSEAMQRKIFPRSGDGRPSPRFL